MEIVELDKVREKKIDAGWGFHDFERERKW